MTIKPITLRNVPPEIAAAIRRRARLAHISLSKAVTDMLKDALGNLQTPKEVVDRHDLDALAGRWSEAEGRRFERSLARQRRIEIQSRTS